LFASVLIRLSPQDKGSLHPLHIPPGQKLSRDDYRKWIAYRLTIMGEAATEEQVNQVLSLQKQDANSAA